jgi:general secretion pathway protein G
MTRKKPISKRRGFSLLELLAVVTILGIIAVVIIPRLSVNRDTAARNAHMQNLAEINSAVERYFFENGSFPADISVLDGDAAYFPDGIPVDPIDGTAYSLDATTGRAINNHP